MLRSPLRPLLRPPMQGLVGPGPYTLVQKAIGILRKYGTNAHVYLPGVGTVSGITAGNYLDSAGVTAASVDNPVGLVVDSFGAVNATQATTANKPILRRGLLNQLLWNTDNTQGANSGPTANATISPTTVTLNLVDSAYFSKNTVQVFASGTPVTVQATVSSTVNRSVLVRAANANTGGANDVKQNVALTSSPQTVTLNLTLTSAAQIGFGIDNRTIAGATDTGTSGVITLTNLAVFQGTYTAQQILDAGGIPITTTAAASNPSAGKYSWQFDGSNDSLSLSSPLFQMVDDHCVIAGCTLGSNATTRYLINTGAGAGSQRVCALFITGTNSVNVGWTDDVTAANIASPSTYPGQTLVVSGVKQANAKRLRINGAQAGSTENTVMGVTTLTGGGAIGDWRPSGGNNWIGSIYPVIAIKGTVSDSDLLTLERFVGQLSGVSI